MQPCLVRPRDTSIPGGLHVRVAPGRPVGPALARQLRLCQAGRSGDRRPSAGPRGWNQSVDSRSGPYDVQLCLIWPRDTPIPGGLHVLVAADDHSDRHPPHGSRGCVWREGRPRQTRCRRAAQATASIGVPTWSRSHTRRTRRRTVRSDRSSRRAITSSEAPVARSESRARSSESSRPGDPVTWLLPLRLSATSRTAPPASGTIAARGRRERPPGDVCAVSLDDSASCSVRAHRRRLMTTSKLLA